MKWDLNNFCWKLKINFLFNWFNFLVFLFIFIELYFGKELFDIKDKRIILVELFFFDSLGKVYFRLLIWVGILFFL